MIQLQRIRLFSLAMAGVVCMTTACQLIPKPTLTTQAVQPVKAVSTLNGHTAEINSVAISPNGRTIASGSKDQTVKLWDVATQKEIRTLKGHTNYVWSVAFSPNGQTLASSGKDGSIRLWRVANGQLIRVLKGHSGEVNVVTFSPDGTLLASGGDDRTVKLWNPKTGITTRTLSNPGTGIVTDLAFSRDGRTLASSSFGPISSERDNSITLWNPVRGNRIRMLNLGTEAAFAIAFSPDGQTLASAHNGVVVTTVSGNGESPQVSRQAGSNIYLWNLTTSTQRNMVGHSGGSVFDVSISPDGRTVATAGEDGTIALWNLQTGQAIRTLTGHSGLIYTLTFSPTGQMLASGSDDRTIKLWHLQT